VAGSGRYADSRADVASVNQPSDGFWAAWQHPSYEPGDRALLRVAPSVRRLSYQLFRVGPGHRLGQTGVRCAPVSNPVSWSVGRRRSGRRPIGVAIRYWDSGLYLARLETAAGAVRFAPVVVRPHRLGRRPVLVVVPTHTWQAHNLWDSDGDGLGDSWLLDPARGIVDLDRPFLDGGLPPFLDDHESPFLEWLHQSGRHADFITDADLLRLRNGEQLIGLYDSIVFPSPIQYATRRAFELIERFRDLGGKLAFFSPGNFVYEVDAIKKQLFLKGRFRDRGSPEASLVGVQQIDTPSATSKPHKYRVTAVGADWELISRIGLKAGDRIGRFPGEADTLASASPPATLVLAEAVNESSAGVRAAMTCYSTITGGLVFATGASTLPRLKPRSSIALLLSSVWDGLAAPPSQRTSSSG